MRLGAVAALGFNALPPRTSPHEQITREAALAAGWPRSGLPALLRAVRRPDLVEHRLEPDLGHVARVAPRQAYAPEHHADRVDGDHEEAFLAVAAYIADRRTAAREARRARDAVTALGEALHAAQDAFSHSSYADMDEDGRRAFLRALLEGAKPPSATRMTRFGPHGPQEHYGHDEHAKDAPMANQDAMHDVGGRSAYDMARAGAVQASHAILTDYLSRQDAASVARLKRLDAPRRKRVVAVIAGAALLSALTMFWAWRGRLR